MQAISKKDKERLRALASKQLEFANSEENTVILKKWQALADKKRETPTVRLLFSNFQHEVVGSRLQCEGAQAREVERKILSTLVGRELFDDDTPISAQYQIEWQAAVSPFGIGSKITQQASSENSNGYHIDAVIEDLDESFESLKGGSFSVNKESTQEKVKFAQETIGDILQVTMIMPSLTGAITNPLVHLMGMENYYMAMYDTPETLHKVMDMATNVYERYYDYLEQEKLLLPTYGLSPVAQESFAFNNELSAKNALKSNDCWGFLESQETTAVSPEMYGEFVFPYQTRLVNRYGLLSYGCCERVDAIFEKYLSQWQNLRKLSVSPFNNEQQVGDFLRGSDIVYYSKPRADHLAIKGTYDEQAVEDYFKTVCTAASGCLFEVAQREVGTLFNNPELGKKYVKDLKNCIEKYWQP